MVVVDRGDNSQIKGEFLGGKTPKVETKMPVEDNDSIIPRGRCGTTVQTGTAQQTRLLIANKTFLQQIIK